MRTKLLVPLLVAGVTLPAGSLALSDPPNDGRDDAATVPPLPQLITGTTQDADTGRADADTCAATAGSVWYRFDPGSSRRVVAKLAAQGDLDAVVDVFLRERSQQRLLTCDVGDRNGRAAVAFNARRGQSYLVRVARRENSVDGTFQLRLTGAGGPRLPGPRLPEEGVSGRLDRVERTAQVWSVRLGRGERYRFRLRHQGPGCLRASIYKAGVRPGPSSAPLAEVNCRGYGLFTPRPGQGRRFSVFVFAQGGVRGPQRYHLQAARAGVDDSAPGRFVENYARVDGTLDGSSVDAVDLYRFDVTRRSALFMSLRTPARDAALDLLLLDAFGNVIRCDCDQTGGASLVKGLRPGRYFVAARARGASRAPYTLLRASREITRTRIRVDGGGRTTVLPGSAATVGVEVSPAASGPVAVTFEQFDPLSGWQFVRRVRTRATGGIATVPFTPPTEGRWRASAEYLGTQGSAPSETEGWVRILAARPLRD